MIQTVELVWPLVKIGRRKVPSKDFGMMPTWKTKNGKISKFVDAGGYRRNEKEGNWRFNMGRERGVETKINLL